MGTSVEESSGNPVLIDRAKSYNMHAFPRVDGQNTLEVYDVVSQAAEYARTTGPVLLEVMTYRYLGHGVSDRLYDSETRKEEMSRFKDRDPIDVMAEHIRAQGYPDTDETFKRIHAQVEEQVEASIEFARQSPEPTVEDLYRHIYV
jgi:pyruvate dehydrogenase E1 component alpha subunit